MKLFDKVSVGNVIAGNRFVRSATWEGLATEKGAVTPRLLDFMKPLAEGGTGLLITSHMYVQQAGQASPWQIGIYDDSLIPGLREISELAHRAHTPIFAQIAHAGVNADASLSGLQPLGPMATENARGEKSRAMTEEDIARMVEDFAQAAHRAKEAGFDGVQVHAAHGYGLGQFLSPYYNKRTDRYGGSVEKRASALVEVCRAIRGTVGKDYPLAVKINAEDFFEPSVEAFTPEMMVATSEILEGEGVDAIEMSGGGGPKARYRSSRRFDPKTPEAEGYYREEARLYKSRVKIPLMLVGGIRSPEGAQRFLDEGLADMIALSRPLIREPGIVGRWASGDLKRSGCISCDACRAPAREGKGLRCVLVE